MNVYSFISNKIFRKRNSVSLQKYSTTFDIDRELSILKEDLLHINDQINDYIKLLFEAETVRIRTRLNLNQGFLRRFQAQFYQSVAERTSLYYIKQLRILFIKKIKTHYYIGVKQKTIIKSLFLIFLRLAVLITLIGIVIFFVISFIVSTIYFLPFLILFCFLLPNISRLIRRFK